MFALATIAFLLLALAFVGTIADWFDNRDADASAARNFRAQRDAMRRAAR